MEEGFGAIDKVDWCLVDGSAKGILVLAMDGPSNPFVENALVNGPAPPAVQTALNIFSLHFYYLDANQTVRFCTIYSMSGDHASVVQNISPYLLATHQDAG